MPAAYMTLDQYAIKYSDYFKFERHDGIVTVLMHTRDDSPIFGPGLLKAWGQLWQDVGNDPANEVLIFGSVGNAWIKGYDAKAFAKPFKDWSPDEAYEHYYDGIKVLENLVFGVDIPTIGVLNGPGIRKEIALMCDITICSEDAVIADGNFTAGSAAGDGMHLVLQELLGAKRAAYAIYNKEQIDAEMALHLGLVNEVLPLDKLLDRAQSLAEVIMKQPKAARRLTHANLQRPWKRRLTEDQGFGYANQVFTSRLV